LLTAASGTPSKEPCLRPTRWALSRTLSAIACNFRDDPRLLLLRTRLCALAALPPPSRRPRCPRIIGTEPTTRHPFMLLQTHSNCTTMAPKQVAVHVVYCGA
jgi:hypothetical protein